MSEGGVLKKIITNNSDSSEEKLEKILERFEKKINSLDHVLTSPILNGGFETIISKVDNIEESQGILTSKVDKISEALYEPDIGLFSRIKQTGVAAREERLELERDVIKLNTWKDSVEKELQFDVIIDKEIGKKIETLNHKRFEDRSKIDNVINWQNRANSIIKWSLVTLGSAGIGGLIKFLFDLI